MTGSLETPSAPTSIGELPDAAIEALVADLRALHRQAALEFALRVGQLVLDRLYGGDLQAWRDRGVRDGSFRKLAAALDPHGIPGLSSTSLARALGTLELDRRVGVSGRRQLHASHVATVLGLPDDAQERLLGEAEAQDWTVTQLRAAVEQARRDAANGRRLGRPPLPAFVKTANRWEREVEDAAGLADLDRVHGLDDAEAARLQRAAEAMSARCADVIRALGRRTGVAPVPTSEQEKQLPSVQPAEEIRPSSSGEAQE